LAASLIFGFLRAVNVGGRKLVMRELAEALRDLGLTEVETFIASGNVVFADDGRDPAALRTLIEDGIEAHFGYRAEVFLRTQADLQAIAQHVAAERRDSDIAINIAFIDQSPRAATLEAFAPFQSEIERFVVYDDHVIWFANVKMSETPFFYKSIKAKSLPLMTIRTYNTIDRMLAKWGA
jgi:uncharacterized protein (DUF1697 family)